jgi:hypothetical protein
VEVPLIATRVKEPNRLSSPQIDGGGIGALMAVAQHAREGQILRGGRAGVLAADDVVNLMRKSAVRFTD